MRTVRTFLLSVVSRLDTADKRKIVKLKLSHRQFN